MFVRGNLVISRSNKQYVVARSSDKAMLDQWLKKYITTMVEDSIELRVDTSIT